jgi:hypothetical protein
MADSGAADLLPICSRASAFAAVFASLCLLTAASCTRSEGFTRRGPAEATTTAVPDTTEGSASPRSSTSAKGREEGSDLPLLWVVTPEGLFTESGDLVASAEAPEAIFSPLDDTMGGVVFLRCPAEGDPAAGVPMAQGRTGCSLEHVAAIGEDPVVVFDESNSATEVPQGLLAVGHLNGRTVFIASMEDLSIEPDFELNTSARFGRVFDVESGEVSRDFADWYGWESGPFGVDVENDLFAACFGEGDACELATFDENSEAGEIIDEADSPLMISLVLAEDATSVTWLQYGGRDLDIIQSVQMDLTTKKTVTREIAVGSETNYDQISTDGTWVASLAPSEVRFVELGNTRNKGVREVPEDTAEVAIRTTGGSFSGASPL